MSSTRRILGLTGLLAVLLALTVALGACGSSSDSSDATLSSAAGEEASAWLESQLQTATKGKYCESFNASAKVGQTIECMLAFKAAGRSTPEAAAYEYVLENMNAYVGATPCESKPTVLRAGSVAKLALAVAAEGGNPSEVGSGKRNLIADLKCLQIKSGGEAGRFEDIFNEKTEESFSNVTGQSLAIIALKACQKTSCETGVATPISNGAAYLRGQQCGKNGAEPVEGAFRSPMGLAAGTCNAKTPFETPYNANAIEVDSTGAAVQALLTEGSTKSVTAAGKAVTWLEGAINKEKHFWSNYCSESEPTKLLESANSTALGIMAYAKKGLSVTEPQGWLESVVEGNAEGGLPACTASGSANVPATAQGVLGLYGTSYPKLAGL
jgi:hypothetical protein